MSVGSAWGSVRRNNFRLYAGPFRLVSIFNHGVNAWCFILVGQPYVRFTHALTSGGLPPSKALRPRVTIVQELGQLLAQAFIALAFVA